MNSVCNSVHHPKMDSLKASDFGHFTNVIILVDVHLDSLRLQALFTHHLSFVTCAMCFVSFLSGGERFSEGTSADREIQRTLMELLNQMDGFDSLGQVS